MTREEAISNVRSFLGQLTEGCQEAIRVLVPELAESDDERIRKELKKAFEEYTKSMWNGIPTRSILAYLEKLKEQKPEVERDIAQPVEQAGNAEPDYGICDKSVPGNLSSALRRHGWYLGHVGENQQYVEARKEEVKRNWPADRDSLTQEKDLIMANSPQLEHQPAEWSEEDERIANEILDHFNTGNAEWFNWFNARFKSLRPQPHWKPSEEQMNALSWAINCLTDIEQGCASTLALLKFNLKEML